MFSTDNVVKPDVFDMLESECFFKGNFIFLCFFFYIINK